jgi:hypothetical protein
LLALLSLLPNVQAVESVRFKVASVSGSGWQVQDLDLAALAQTDGWSVSGRIGRLALPEPLGELESVDFACPRLRAKGTTWNCPDASFRAGSGALDAPQFRGAVAYQPGLRLDLQLDDVAVAGGRLGLHLASGGGRWKVSSRATGLNAAQLPGALRTALGIAANDELAGRLEGEGQAEGRSAQLNAIALSLRLRELRYARPDGKRECQGLSGNLRLAGARRGPQWQGQASVSLEQGLLYADPVLLDLGAEPVTIEASGLWSPRQRLDLAHFAVHATGMLHAEGSLGLELRPALAVSDATLSLQAIGLPAAYERLLRPWLLGTPWDSLELGGRLGVQAAMGQSGVSLTANAQDVRLVDRQGRFGIFGLTGRVGWHPVGERVSELAWSGAKVYDLPFGAGRVQWESRGDAFRLRAPLTVPVLGGSLRVDTLQAMGVGRPSAVWQADGIITPMEMPKLSRALHWPVMAGEVSAVIPRVRYSKHVLDIGGAVLLKVFDGDVVVRNLRLTRPLDLVPELALDADIQRLDLEALTQAFSFGTITGRLEGTVRGLHLRSWEPVAFQASFRTPPDDHSSHRVDQRAVRNLSSLGGGVAGMLSQGFLGLFDKFYYRRLGLSCRLARGLCELDGIAPAANGGFYIVEGGGGLPTLDVIGYSHRVNWDVLLQRLRAAVRPQP